MNQFYKIILTFFIAFTSILSSKGYDFEVDGLYYNILSDNTVEVTYKSLDFYEEGLSFEEISIPSTVSHNGITYTVTTIGEVAFRFWDNLKTVYIPNSVSSISWDPFASCDELNNIFVSDDNKYFCSINGVLYNKEVTKIIRCPQNRREIELPVSIMVIGAYSFSFCDILSIILPDSVTTIEQNAFHCCLNLSNVTIPNSVNTIGDSAFQNCPYLSNLNLSDTIFTIGRAAFFGCNSLTSIYIGTSVVKIGDQAFSYCLNLSEIQVSEENKNYCSIEGILYNKNAFTLICCPCGKSEVKIPDSVERIEDYSFFHCINLTSIKIPDSVISIGSWAFTSCDALEEVSIGKSLKEIGDCPFSSCYNLNNYHISAENQYFCDIEGIWYNKNVTEIVSCPPGRDHVILPETITHIGDWSFAYCDKLTEFDFPEKVISIGKGAFTYCNLSTFIIPSSITEIGDAAFQNCQRIQEITIPASLSVLGEYVFVGCNQLRQINLPNSITSIGYSCFNSCSNLGSIELGENLSEIGENAFAYCDGLQIIKVNALTPPKAYENSFDDKAYENVYLIVPDDVLTDYENSVPWLYFNHIKEDSNVDDFNWEVLGKGFFYNKLFGVDLDGNHSTAICVERNIIDPYLFRASNPFYALNHEETYLDFRVLQKGDIILGIDITQDNLVYFKDYPIMYIEDFEGVVDMIWPGHFVEYNNEYYCTHSFVKTYQEISCLDENEEYITFTVPKEIILSPIYICPESGYWMGDTTSDETINILFPDTDLTDTSLQITCKEMSASNHVGSILANIDLGKSLTSAKIAICRTEDVKKTIKDIINGNIECREIKESGDLSLSFQSSGDSDSYSIVGVGFIGFVNVSSTSTSFNTPIDAGIGDTPYQDDKYEIYNLTGIKVLSTYDKGQIQSLLPGLYIINGKKVMIGK